MYIVPPFAFKKPTRVFSMIHLGLESFIGRKQFLNSMNMLSKGTVSPYSKQVWHPKQRSFFISQYIQTFTMRNNLGQENPYQVKNRRFRRRGEDDETGTRMQISRQRRQGYQSPSSVKPLTLLDYRQQEKALDEFKLESKLSVQTQNETKQSSQVKSRQKIRRKSQYDQQLEFKVRGLQQVLKQKQERIKLLETLLQQKNSEYASLKANVVTLEAIKQQKLQSQRKYQEEIHLLQLTNSEEIYKLNQKVKKCQIELACTNKKWRDEFDRVLKEKDQEIRGFRQKYSNLLRSNRQKSKMGQFATQQVLPTPNFRFQKQRENDSLELSSFQLSK